MIEVCLRYVFSSKRNIFLTALVLKNGNGQYCFLMQHLVLPFASQFLKLQNQCHRGDFSKISSLCVIDGNNSLVPRKRLMIRFAAMKT